MFLFFLIIINLLVFKICLLICLTVCDENNESSQLETTDVIIKPVNSKPESKLEDEPVALDGIVKIF